MNETPAPSLPDIPETDDPVVLRELLRQAREHLRLRDSIERVMAENVARTETLLIEARAASHDGTAPDTHELRLAVESARSALREVATALERVEALIPATDETDAGELAASAGPSPARTDTAQPGGPRTIELVMQEVTSPAIARSVQQYLAGLDMVMRAEVRELAEGLLRITVETSAPLTGETLAGWEPERDRTIRTERADVLEIELG